MCLNLYLNKNIQQQFLKRYYTVMAHTKIAR